MSKPYKFSKVYARKVGNKIMLKRGTFSDRRHGKGEAKAADQKPPEESVNVEAAAGEVVKSDSSFDDMKMSGTNSFDVDVMDCKVAESSESRDGRKSRAFQARKKFDTVTQRTQKFFSSLVHFFIFWSLS